MSFYLRVNQPAKHALVLGIEFHDLGFEKIHTLLAQLRRDLHTFLPKRELIGRWEKAPSLCGIRGQPFPNLHRTFRAWGIAGPLMEVIPRELIAT
jgi:hypothetical protein